VLLLSPRRKAVASRDGAVLLIAYANYANYLLFVVGQWPDWRSSVIMLAAVSGRSAAWPPGPRVSQMFPPS